jgi:ATP-dependent RNA helicase RhlB
MLKKIIRKIASLAKPRAAAAKPVAPKAAARPAAHEKGSGARAARPSSSRPPASRRSEESRPSRSERGASAQDRGPRRERRDGPARPAGERPASGPSAPGEGGRRRSRGGRGRRGGEGAARGPEAGEQTEVVPSAGPETTWDPASFVVEPVEGSVRFADFKLHPALLHALADLEFRHATPIQAQSMPDTLAGRDVFGQAQTGTGKTAAFLLTLFQRMLDRPDPAPRRGGTPRALVLAPTRELAVQIERDALALGRHTGLASVCVFGGADMDRQRRRLRQGVDILIATPGRLLDFHSQHEVHLNRVETLVIDEADRMLDMGFIPDVRRIVYSTPPKDRRQTMLYSATLSEPVQRLAASWTRDPIRIEVAQEHRTVDTIDQRVYIARATEKFPLLYNLIQKENWDRVLLFVNRRITAERVVEMLRRTGFEVRLISGALNQAQRTRALEDFRGGVARVLVATDVAGRGLHIDAVSHVVNFNIPLDPEDYVHRIGRTGRAGASGTSVTFACEEESFYLPPIEEYIGRPLKCTQPPEDYLRLPESLALLPPIDDRPERRGPPRDGGRRGPPRGGPRRGPPRR